MSRHLEEHLDLCAGFALESLDPADRARLIEHLDQGCEVCEEALREFGGTTLLLASAAPVAQPDPGLRERVLSAARALAAPAEPRAGAGRVIELGRRRYPRWTALAWAAAAALAIAVGLQGREAARLGRELEDGRRRFAELERRLGEEQRWQEVLSAPGARLAVIAPTAAGAHELRGRATYDPATRRAVLVFENVQAPAGRDYELWAIRGAGPALRAGTPRALGLIKPDDSGRAVMRLEDAGDPATLNAFAVSLEPAGGAPTPDAPTGPVVMLGKLGG